MRCLVMTYFQDESGEWHQPGNVDDIKSGEAVRLERSRAVKIIETAMVEQPEIRVVQMRRKRE